MSVIDGQDETETEQFKELYMKNAESQWEGPGCGLSWIMDRAATVGAVEAGARREGVAERKP